MHVYGHKWACQLVYNPHLIEGLDLLDSEGTERLWSYFIKLIGIEHSSLVGVTTCYYINWLSGSDSNVCGWSIVKPLLSDLRWSEILEYGSNVISRKGFTTKERPLRKYLIAVKFQPYIFNHSGQTKEWHSYPYMPVSVHHRLSPQS